VLRVDPLSKVCGSELLLRELLLRELYCVSCYCVSYTDHPDPCHWVLGWPHSLVFNPQNFV
jgi:hypothetical protein